MFLAKILKIPNLSNFRKLSRLLSKIIIISNLAKIMDNPDFFENCRKITILLIFDETSQFCSKFAEK